MRIEPFDPTDPAERMADKFRKDVAGLASVALNNADYRGLSSIEQVQCFMAGVATGLIGVCFAHVENAGHDAMMEAIVDYLPQAREQAEAIMEDAVLRHS